VLDALAKAQELRLPVSRQSTFATSNVVHSRSADLTFDRLVAIQHGEFEHHPLVVVTQRLSPRQRHRSFPKFLPVKCYFPEDFVERMKADACCPAPAPGIWQRMGFQMEESSVPQDHREECWLIYYGDIHVFAVAKRVGRTTKVKRAISYF
jgi:hypothetical protein